MTSFGPDRVQQRASWSRTTWRWTVVRFSDVIVFRTASLGTWTYFLMLALHKAFSQDKVQQRVVELTLRFLEQNIKVIKVFSLDRVQQRFVAMNIKVTKALPQDRVQQRLVEQNITIIKGFLHGQSSTAIRGDEHQGHQGSVPGQGSTALGGAEHHDHAGFSPWTEFNSDSWR